MGGAKAEIRSLRGDWQANHELTPFVVSVALPAFDIHEVFKFDLRPMNPEESSSVVERLEELLDEFGESFGDKFVAVDHHGSADKLERIRRVAAEKLEEWRDRLKIAEDALIRVDGAKQQMSSMREMYYKEISMLRQQLHMKAEAERACKEHLPEDLCLFDPSDFVFDDGGDLIWILRQKAEVLQRRFNMHSARISERFNEVQDKLKTKNALLRKKEELLQGLLQKHGYKNEVGLERGLAKPAAVADPSAEAEPPATEDSAEGPATEGKVSTSALAFETTEDPAPSALAPGPSAPTSPAPEPSAPEAKAPWSADHSAEYFGPGAMESMGPPARAKLPMRPAKPSRPEAADGSRSARSAERLPDAVQRRRAQERKEERPKMRREERADSRQTELERKCTCGAALNRAAPEAAAALSTVEVAVQCCISESACLENGENVAVSLEYTWAQDQALPVWDHLAELRRVIGIPEEVWHSHLVVSDVCGNVVDVLSPLVEELFPLRVRFSTLEEAQSPCPGIRSCDIDSEPPNESPPAEPAHKDPSCDAGAKEDGPTDTSGKSEKEVRPKPWTVARIARKTRLHQVGATLPAPARLGSPKGEPHGDSAPPEAPVLHDAARTVSESLFPEVAAILARHGVVDQALTAELPRISSKQPSRDPSSPTGAPGVARRSARAPTRGAAGSRRTSTEASLGEAVVAAGSGMQRVATGKGGDVPNKAGDSTTAEGDKALALARSRRRASTEFALPAVGQPPSEPTQAPRPVVSPRGR
mmetsp:Transcript_32777/g.93996  ORF Transcript_32777/g.93996 Transcript_32777/m.93996 type:complete len:762 (-) Transcript_32777:36-2321(-)